MAKQEKLFYVGAVIKISVLIFHLHKVNLWKSIKENEYSLCGFMVHMFIALACLFHFTQQGTLRGTHPLLLPSYFPGVSLWDSICNALTHLSRAKHQTTQVRQAEKLKICLQNFQEGNIM